MQGIIGCLDASDYAAGVCDLSAWAQARTSLPVTLLHVAEPHDAAPAKGDMSGYLALGAKSGLLQKLTRSDAEHGRAEHEKGREILARGKAALAEKNIVADLLHRRGQLSDILAEQEAASPALIIIGKRGESGGAHNRPGGNIERVARATHAPIVIASLNSRPIRNMLIAHDGGAAADKALEFALTSPLLAGLPCHLLKAGDAAPEENAAFERAEEKLRRAGILANACVRFGQSAEDAIADYIEDNHIDLLLIGAYSHSKIHNFMFGSHTNALIGAAKIPVMLCR